MKLVLTKREKRGFLLLILLLSLSVWLSYREGNQSIPDLYDFRLEDSLFQLRSGDTLKTILDKKAPSKERSGKRSSADDKRIPLVDVNRAGIEQWEKLPYIGPARAQAIVNDREINGPFKSIEDLTRVRGIGNKTLELVRPYLIITQIDSSN